MTQQIQANGINMVYRIDGPENAPIVMLSNSLMSNHTMWDPQMDALTETYRVLRYDTRGHGGTDTTPGPYSIQLLAEDAIALLDALNIDKVHFTGLSMGGMIAQYVGAHYPERVLSLILCDTASEMPTLDMWNERIAKAENHGIASLLDGTLQRWFTQTFRDNDTASIEKVAEMIRTTDANGYIGCANAVRDMSQTSILSKIKAPTIIITGEEDPACTVEQAKVLEANIDGAQLVILKDAAHLANIEKTAEFNQAMLEFLNAQT